MNERWVRRTVALAALLIGVAGCDGDDSAQSGNTSPSGTSDATAPATVPDKSGATPAEPLTIRLVNENSNPGAEGAGLDEFVRLVDELSDGAMQVEILSTGRLPNEVWDAQRGPDAHTQAVINGSADMGFVGNNYWGYEGVTSTQAAQAPLLIRSAAQGVAVSQDADLVADLFAGLDDVGVVGLQMFPQNFKVLVGFDGAITSAADLDGDVLQSRAAPELFSFYEALGTEPQQDSVGRQDYVAPPWIQADWDQGVAVGNLPIYFVYYDLVANDAFWTGLTDEQRGVLEEAAATAQNFVVDHLPEDESADDLAAYCERGSEVNHLGAAAIAEFEAASLATVQGLQSDAALADLIDRISELGDGQPPTVYPECTPGSTSADASALPAGVYRFEVTEDDLQRIGIDPEQWQYDVGVFTVTIDDGTFTWTQQSPTNPSIDEDAGAYEGGGTYEVDGDDLVTVETALGDPVTTTLTWALSEDGSLTFLIVEADKDFPRFFYGEPWIRIGDV